MDDQKIAIMLELAGLSQKSIDSKQKKLDWAAEFKRCEDVFRDDLSRRTVLARMMLFATTHAEWVIIHSLSTKLDGCANASSYALNQMVKLQPSGSDEV